MGYNVPSSSSSIIFVIWCLVNNIPFAFPIGDTELGHECGSSSDPPITSAYNESRALVVSSLIINTALSDGFWSVSGGYPDPNQPSYGLALCRGDVSPIDCKSCVNNATLTLINTHCPSDRSAILWRDFCFIKYSDLDFFGKPDTNNSHRLMNYDDWILENSTVVVMNLLGNLIQTAIQDPTKFYAKGSDALPEDPDHDVHEEDNSVYGMVQCTRDLTPDDCKKCLTDCASKIPALTKGGHVVDGSCNLRFETYNFLNS